jgi:hypothetical protein
LDLYNEANAAFKAEHLNEGTGLTARHATLSTTTQGVAFTDVDTSRLWFPAASAATEQQCRFNFGAAPFRHACPQVS